MSISDAVTLYFWLFLALFLVLMVHAAVEERREAKEKKERPGHVLSEIEIWPDTLLRQGYDGGNQTFLHEPSGKSLKLRKYIRAKGDYGLELWIHEQEARDDLDKVKDVVESLGLTYRVEPSEAAESHAIVLIIECHRDPVRAYELVRAIWTEGFGFTDQTRFAARYERVSPFDDLIDCPDQGPEVWDPSSWKEVWTYLDKRSRRYAGRPIKAHFYELFSLLVLLITWPAFLLSMIQSRGDTPEWSLELGEGQLGGSTESLCFFVISLICFAIVRRYRRMSLQKAKKPRPTYIWLPGRVMMIAMPFMTILAWTGY